MAQLTSTEWALARRPVGLPQHSDFQKKTTDVPEPSDGELQVRVSIPDRMIGLLKKGQKAVVTYPSFPQLRHDGIVDEIGPRGEEANTFSSTVRIVKPSPDIRAGISAEVTFSLQVPGYKTAFALPVSAFVPAGSGKQRGFVFVVTPEKSTLSKRTVKVVAIRGNDVLIGDGLKDGDRVVVAGVSFLHDGMTVTLLAAQ